MTQIGNQISFDPLDYVGQYEEGDHSKALADRNAHLKQLRKEGKQVRGWTLTRQLRTYASFGVPDGRVRNVYYITVG